MLEPLRTESLASHLADRYGVPVVGSEALEPGVFRVDREDGTRWVARVFSASRPLSGVQEEAEILNRLEQASFPAERCADATPVSELAGQPVLVTGFLEAREPLPARRTMAILGALLGRLHARPVRRMRPGGAWHHLSLDGGPREELLAAGELLDDHVSQVPIRQLALFDRLRDEVARLDDCHDLPAAFVHPDFVPANAIAIEGDRLAVIDWTGAGLGPRLWSLGFLLWAAGARDLRLVDVVVSRYRRSLELEPAELARLEPAIYGRPVTLEAWSVCAGRRQLPTAIDRIEHAREAAGAIAARARQAFASPVVRPRARGGHRDPDLGQPGVG